MLEIVKVSKPRNYALSKEKKWSCHPTTMSWTYIILLLSPLLHHKRNALDHSKPGQLNGAFFIVSLQCT